MKQDLSSMINSKSGLDTAIETVQSYIKNPKLITPETMQELLTELETFRDEEMSEPDESGHGESYGPIEHGHEPAGLTVLIGSMKPKNGGSK